MTEGHDDANTPRRRSCIACALKHLAQARALLLECRKGYPEHVWFAIGHMAEAEDETLVSFPEIAKLINPYRKQLELQDDFMPPFTMLVRQIMAVEETLTRQQIQQIVEHG